MNFAKKIGTGAAVALAAAFLMLLWTGFDPEAFLYDDNRLQWFPVIERAYEQLLETGELPGFTFYLAKGLNVADPGYYGVTNPFMLLSFLISRAISGRFSTVTVYIAMMTGLGCAVMYALCKRLTGSGKISLLSVAALLCCGSFFAYGHWYYIFNNLFFIPLLLYAFITSAGKKREFFICGVILAAEIYCGNVQYTCYHYIVFCIICLIAAVHFKKRSIISMLTNIAVGIGLSLPIFVMLLRASSGVGGNQFLDEPISLTGMITRFFIPDGILGAASSSLRKNEDSFICCIAPCLLPVIIYAAAWIAGSLKNIKGQGEAADIKAILARAAAYFGSNAQAAMILGIGCSAAVFVNISHRGIFAFALSFIPVINKFRFLFKAMFVALPLITPLTALCIGSSRGRVKTAAAACCIGFTAIGAVNNFFVAAQMKENFSFSDFSTVEENAAELSGYVREAGVDLKNYRAACLLPHKELCAAWFEGGRNDIKNFAAYMEYFSLSAYEIPLDPHVREQYGCIYDPESGFDVYVNASTVSFFYSSCQSEPEETARQLKDNSVKYLIVQREGSIAYDLSEEEMKAYRTFDNYTDELLEVLSALPGISAGYAGEFSPGYDLIVLDGVNSICTSGEGEFLPLSDTQMNKLAIEPDGSGSLTLSMNYDKRVTAVHTAEDGSITPLTVEGDEAGNCVINTGELTGGSVTVSYDDPVFTAALVMEAVVTVLLLAAGIFLGAKE